MSDFVIGGLGSLIGFGGAATTPNARGNVIYQSATIPLAKGGKALMAEAGAEAIMPLDRTADGTLGVRAIGMGNAGGMMVNYAPVFNISGSNVETTQGGSAPGAQEELLKLLDREVYAAVMKVLTAEFNNGGMFNPAAKPYG